MTAENRSIELQEFLARISADSIDDVDFTDLSATCADGDTALHIAIRSRYFEMAREMVKLGIAIHLCAWQRYSTVRQSSITSVKPEKEF
jgi:hypothetical protein